MLRDFFAGRKSVAATYWLGYVIVGSLAALGLRFLTRRYLMEPDQILAEVWWQAMVAVQAGLFLYFLFVLRAVVKACYFQRRPGGWGGR